jgi:hypothetical protein
MSRFKDTTPEAFQTLLIKRFMSTSRHDRLVILAYAGLQVAAYDNSLGVGGEHLNLPIARKVAESMRSGLTLEDAIKKVIAMEESE